MAKYVYADDIKFYSECFYNGFCTLYTECNHCDKSAFPILSLDGLDPWIPCGDELPTDDNCYIVAWRPIGKDIGFKHYDAILQFCPEENCFADNDVIARMRKNWAIELLAWMPLPDDYEGD